MQLSLKVCYSSGPARCHRCLLPHSLFLQTILHGLGAGWSSDWIVDDKVTVLSFDTSSVPFGEGPLLDWEGPLLDCADQTAGRRDNPTHFEFFSDVVGYQKIKCHMIFDVKLGENFRRKARLVAGGHVTEVPSSMTYSSVVSRDSVRIALTIASGTRPRVF
eukprot:scaffold1692_cov79-Cylindrotheca_fusiformis.AAC.2